MTAPEAEDARSNHTVLKRVLGAVMLLALASFTVPVLLDGRGIRQSGETLVLPDEPVFDVRLGDSGEPEIRLIDVKGMIERTETQAVAAEAMPLDGENPQPGSPIESDPAAGTPSLATTSEPPADGALASGEVLPETASEPSVSELSGDLPDIPDAGEVPAFISFVDSGVGDVDPGVPESALNEGRISAAPSRNTPAAAVAKPPQTTPQRPASPPPAVAKADVAEAWTVQLGAFSNRANAERTVAMLNAKGFRAYLGLKTPGVSKVLVGPEIRRDRAEALKARIQASTGMAGVITRYVP